MKLGNRNTFTVFMIKNKLSNIMLEILQVLKNNKQLFVKNYLGFHIYTMYFHYSSLYLDIISKLQAMYALLIF